MATVMVAVLVVVMAAVGAGARYLVSELLNTQFPYGTLFVNLVASFALGWLSQTGEQTQTVLGIGALGALSTWSAVANEVARLARSEQGTLAALYLMATVSTGILAAWAGLQMSGTV